MRARRERSTVAGPGRRNEVRQVASPGSSAASRRSISASTRCSSCDSAIRHLRVVLGQYPFTISQEPVFIQLFWLCTSPVFRAERPLCGSPSISPAQTRTLRHLPVTRTRDELNTYDEWRRGKLAVLEKSFYRV